MTKNNLIYTRSWRILLIQPFLLIMPLALQAQDVNIKGEIENAESEYVYFSHLRPQDGQCCFTCMDSVLLDDKGCFCYTMNTDSVALVRMWYSQSMRPVTFFAGKDDMEITLDTKRAFDFKLKGGETYEEQQIYRQYMRGNDSVEFSVRKKELQLEAAYDSISKRAKWLKTGITLESMFETGAYAWLPQRKDMMLTFISKHPDFTISALIAMQILDISPSDYKWINEILGNTCKLPYYLSASVKHAKEVTDCLNNPIGSVAPDFEKRTLAGDYVGDGFMNAKREEANETIAIGKSMKSVVLAKTDYQVKMQFFRKVINDLAQKEDMSHFKQIITRAEIWGDASVELSQSYCQHNNGTKKSTDSIVSNSRLVNDIRMILSQYGMRVKSVECDNVYPMSGSEFLKSNKIRSSNVPEHIFRSDVFIEIE